MLLFGKRLKELRSEKELSQQTLADFLGVSDTIIGRWEKGSSEPTASNINAVAHFFGVSADYLLGNVDEWGVAEVQYPDLKPDEQNFLTAYKKLNSECKQNVLETMELFIRKNKK